MRNVARNMAFGSMAAIAMLAGDAGAEPRPTPADDGAARCGISLDRVTAGPRFADYPASVRRIARPAPVALAGNPEAGMFRTRLRAGAAEGPNFAGSYTIVGWGCGASCLHWAIVDAWEDRSAYFASHFLPAHREAGRRHGPPTHSSRPPGPAGSSACLHGPQP